MLRPMDAVAAVRELAERAKAAGGRALVVGGAVRDRLLGLSPTDFDVEMYGLDPERVRMLVEEIGVTHDVGRAFGVLELRFGGERLHVSIPRRESKVAPGHRGFAVDTDPSLTPEDAARRRDFTINAIAEDPLTGEVVDPFDGRGDLARRVLRVVDANHFGEDPLRVLRAAVFVAQFELAVDAESDAVIRHSVPSVRQLPHERIGEEWRKLLLRPIRPSRGLKLLMDWGVLDVLHSDFVRLPKTPQEPKWHPEGDVWTHTLMTVDEAAHIIRDSDVRGGGEITARPASARSGWEVRWSVMLTALCHDLGKATTTVVERGVLHSRGHDAAGIEPTRRFLKSIAADRRTREVVVRLVREHLLPLRFFNLAARGMSLSDGEVRSLARRLHPATIFLLTLVADADQFGRGPFVLTPEVSNVLTSEVRTAKPPAADAGAQLRTRAAALGVLDGPPLPVLRGTDLLAAGCTPGPQFGVILRRAQELHDEHGLAREELLHRLRGARTAEEILGRLEN